jgi:FtsP/CotA-like multicopper oxidase with cupredoxin domain
MTHGPDHHGPGNAMVAEMAKPRVGEPGTGLEEMPWKVLVYTDLRRLKPDDPPLEPEHEIELHLTGNMERQMWSINGKKFSEDPAPIPIELGKRTRFVLVNDTMMDHPMHIHGMFMILENGHGAQRPYKHTILVKAGERLAFDVKPDESGPFAFHCHLLFHMELGMFRVVGVSGEPQRKHT